MSKRWFGGMVIGAMLVFAAVVYGWLPERVPTHFDMHGEPDAWGSRWVSLAVPIGSALGIWLLARVIPRLDPRGENYERFAETYWFVINLIVLFMAALQVLLVGTALGWPVRVESAMPVLVGLLLIALGNFMPRMKSNWTMGVRTPWTLESESVWRRTHRLAGWCFVAAGVVVVLSVALDPVARLWVLVAGTTLASLVPVVASYLFWRREQRERTA
jgi:uncharacterized membrane protein